MMKPRSMTTVVEQCVMLAESQILNPAGELGLLVDQGAGPVDDYSRAEAVKAGFRVRSAVKCVTLGAKRNRCEHLTVYLKLYSVYRYDGSRYHFDRVQLHRCREQDHFLPAARSGGIAFTCL